MTASIFQPFYAAIDGNGVPMSGALLYFYKTGTTTPQDTYTDSGLGTPNANPVVANSDGLFPPIYLAAGPDYKAILRTTAGVTVATRDPIEAPVALGAVSLPTLRSYLAGLTLSTAGSSATFGIAAGQCGDSTNTALMTLVASMTKTTSAWSAGSGNGALDTGTIVITTWYHVFLIQRTDTGAVDILISTSPSSPTMPSPYTLKRRIGSMKTDSSSTWFAFAQNGDRFDWGTPLADYSSTPASTSAVTTFLTVPLGIVVEALLSGNIADATSSNSGLYISSLAQVDVAPTSFTGAAYTASSESTTTGAVPWSKTVMTNTSQSIRIRTDSTTLALRIRTNGWIDRRGKDT